MARDLPSSPAATERDALLPKLDDIDPEAQADSQDEDLDKPKIPGAKIQYIFPALGLGVNRIPNFPLYEGCFCLRGREW